jgi:hypothetical protein
MANETPDLISSKVEAPVPRVKGIPDAATAAITSG